MITPAIRYLGRDIEYTLTIAHTIQKLRRERKATKARSNKRKRIDARLGALELRLAYWAGGEP